MKKVIVGILISCLFMGLCSFKSKKDESKPVYIYGVAASFKDTVLFVTDIQQLEGVALDKDKFLPYREGYSYEMKSYVENKLGMQDRICAVFFSENLKNITKEYTKLMKKYKKNGGYSIRHLTEEEFEFVKIEPQE